MTTETAGRKIRGDHFDVIRAARRPDLCETWRLADLASDANLFGLYEEEAALRAEVLRRQPPPRPTFEVVGELGGGPCPDQLAASDMAWEGCPHDGRAS